ncbi:hypothetical protein A3B21_01920 [Candidatus Uhrbacteria bacterium RIFCSPLOWO2_01_FULL_47_24]|uniref:Carboxypeptidase regulatory-like domain-containing protein n=1 Tax=Candidatus Uhrbacteria bacterium RIFCSPLOWO2_01_FULL_47_24 TaxID=1802401 RepID=A0A1F7UPB2_9BACT|nr:MAG: hypothetical protein A2753_01670 [Candidatus Uhrbacteria bacterium RIFCSPHIGHO2_01_FULL_47_11]OGL67926.1 MAG: hypothetical protein A3D58_05115 [Candidatus Uhrbacteria bacterium RIFCSPHIGHO2_02_FULL_46_47]OGL75197.1 MAG: hypothetical protein A3F52_04105 [Candidatus Uhrbacteria bacterium RIFCSPHIGHO2_12_FULL_47_11]OGL80112.1 MAG: hypothetical protein A3B21_01920 [Candidatus Uhrbacteria bacterium RIFCSPLOWO2_01_FULL_47_24]OGL84898.1 MAG: hypothetical protein A3J03_04305 [Candidatus Uhrbact
MRLLYFFIFFAALLLFGAQCASAPVSEISAPSDNISSPEDISAPVADIETLPVPSVAEPQPTNATNFSSPQPIIQRSRANDVILFGYVRDSKTNQPFANAFVNLYFEEEYLSRISVPLRTDASGRYELKQLPSNDPFPYPSGRYTIWAAPPNELELERVNYQTYSAEGVVIDASKTQQFDILIFNTTMTEPMPDAIFYGHVTDAASGAPIPDPMVYVYLKNKIGNIRADANAGGFYQFVASNSAHRTITQSQIDFFWIAPPPSLANQYQILNQPFTADMAGKREIDFYLEPK